MTNEIKIPKKIETKLYITLGVGESNFSSISIDEFDMTKHASIGYERVLLTTQNLNIDLKDLKINEANIKAELVTQLRAAQQKIKAEAHIQIEQIQERIQGLLAIECQPEL